MLLQLRMASQAADRLFETHTGMTRAQFHTLAAIEKAQRGEGHGPAQTALVDATGIDRSTMAGIVARLLQSQLITRHRCKTDLRAFEIRLTPAGRKELARVKIAMRDVEETLHRSSATPMAVVAALEKIATVDSVAA